MTDKSTGLVADIQAEINVDTNILGVKTRQRGKGDVVALTLRLSRDDWQRVHQLALAEGISIQKLTVEGLSKLFEAKGLTGLSSST